MSDDPYESGPFCRHYSDPSDCQETCAHCGHRCKWHDPDCSYSEFVLIDGVWRHENHCDCLAWVEPPEA